MGESLVPLPPNSKLTKRTINKLSALLEKGNTDKVACAGSSIAESTFYEWLALGRDLLALPDFSPVAEYDRNAMELVEAVTRAREKAEENAVAAVQNAILGYDSEEITEETYFRFEKDEDGNTIEIPVKSVKTKRWHTAPDARIALDFLARRNPEEWAKRADIQINNNNLNLISADDIESAIKRADEKRRRLLDQYGDSE